MLNSSIRGYRKLEQIDLELEKVAMLTEKQRECLHLVVQRKSSKEIARILNISKPAVDQRLIGARRTLGAANRNEAALIFARAAGDYDRIIYDPAYVPSDPITGAQASSDEQSDATFMLEEAASPYDATFKQENSIWPQVLKGPGDDLGTIQRIAIMVGLTIGILAVVLIGLSVSQSLSGLLAS